MSLTNVTETVGAADVAAVRAFNRFYTRLIGVLDEGIADGPFTLTEARVLFELAVEGEVATADLRARLGLDAGYLSRILSRFEVDGLVVRRKSPDDGRRLLLAITEAGRAAQADSDRRASDQVARLLGELEPARRRRALGAMRAIEDAFGPGGRPGDDRSGAEAGAAGRRLVVLREAEAGELGWMVARHGALYAREYGWDRTFEGLVADIAATHLREPERARIRAWVAEVDGEPAGSVVCARDDDETARLRLLLVEPWARGLGIGSRLVDECLRFARRSGYRRITLATYDVLADARRIYQRAGFTLVDQHPEQAFGHALTAQEWSRKL